MGQHILRERGDTRAGGRPPPRKRGKFYADCEIMSLVSAIVFDIARGGIPWQRRSNPGQAKRHPSKQGNRFTEIPGNSRGPLPKGRLGCRKLDNRNNNR